MKARIPPIQPPYDPATADMLRKWMPPGSEIEPLRLFRTFAVHPELAARMRPLGAAILSHGLLAPRERELMILRTSALAGAEYEWGVHATAFGPGVGISAEDAAAIARPSLEPGRFEGRALLVLRLATELHDTAGVSDELWGEMAAEWSPAEILELVVTAGWYRTIAYVINAAGVEPESWAQRL